MSIFKRLTILVRAVLLASVVIHLAACDGVSEEDSISKAREYHKQRDMRAAGIELKNVLKSNAKNAEARYLLGKISLELGDIASAEKDFQRALDAGWDEATIQLLLAEVLFRRGEFQSVLDDIPLKDVYPDDVRANMMGLWAYSEQGLGKWEDSEDTINAAEKINKDALWVLQSRIRLALKKGDKKSAENTLDHAVARHPASQDLWLLKASLALDKKDYVATDEYLQKVVDLEPKKIISAWGRLARIGQSRVRLLQKESDKALLALQPALDQFPDNPELNYYRAVIAFEQKEYDLVNEHLYTVFKVDPGHYASHLLFANLYYIQQDFKQAAYYLEKATSARPENLAAQKMLGRTYLSLGQYNDATNRFELAAARTSDNAELLTLLGISRIKGGEEGTGLKNLEDAVRSSPDNARIRSELAKAYISTGKADKAIELLESALEKGDESGQSAAVLILVYLREGKFDKAVTMAEELAAQKPESPLPSHLQGLAYRGKNNLKAARSSFTKALQIQPDFVLSILSQADLDAADGDTVSARRGYERALELKPDHAGAMTALAYLLDKEGKVTEAIALLEKARSADDSAIDARLLLSNYYLKKGEAEKALVYALEAEKSSAKSAKVLLMLGRAQLAAGSPDAGKTIENLVKISPNLPDAHYYRALLRAKARDIDGTRQSLDKTLLLAPNHGQAMLTLGRLELTTGNLDAALQIVKKMKVKQPGVAVYLLEGDVLMLKQDHGNAIKAYLAASEQASSSETVARLNKAHRAMGDSGTGYSVLNDWLGNNPDDSSIRFILAVSLLTDGKQDAAITQYEKILEKQPDNAAVLNDLAWLYHLKGKPEALAMARKASRLAPDSPAIQDTYGWLLVKTGRAESGLAALEMAASKLPSNREIGYHLAVALADSGRKERAKQALQKILKDDQLFQGREDAQKLLKQLQ